MNDKRPRRKRKQRMTIIEDQPAPMTNDGASMHDLVIADIKDRKLIGLQRYGTKLQAHNGRDCLVDAYQEALDLCCHLRQAIVERDSRDKEDEDARRDIREFAARLSEIEAEKADNQGDADEV